MTTHRLFRYTSFCLRLAFSLFCASSGICQQGETRTQREILGNAEKEFEFGGVVTDQTITRLIKIAEDSLTNDSVKVEIIRFFGRASCNKCITYLFVHMNDRFYYGDGNSDIDQANFIAAWSTLLNIARNKHNRWNLFPFIFNELKREPKDEDYFSALYPILIFNTDKNTIRCIFEFELNEATSQWSNMRNYIYEDNLRLILKRLN